jgi:hypothetical protein
MRSHVFFIFAALAATAHAQWSSDPATNLVIDDGAGEQTQPKIVPHPDGGFYVSWYDSDPAGSPAFGYDVRLQRLDAAGHELWAAGGVLIADRGFSSTQDYGLAVDASGDALLAFRDDRAGGVQIAVVKVAAAGTVTWDVQVTSTTDFLASPRVAGTSDGEVVVAWTQNSDAKLQRLDSTGSPLWGAGVTLTPGAGSYSPSDLQAGDAGSVVLAFVHQTGAFGSPRHLLAQKLDTAGALQWGAGHVAVFDGGSLQNGNFPGFRPDGSGGGVFAWYEVSPLQCLAQRVDASGSEVFAHNGVVVSTDATRVRVSPSVDYNPSSGETFVAWLEQSSLQDMFGVYAQKLDASGTRQWSSTGAVLVAVGATQLGNVRTLAYADGAQVFWVEGPSFGSQTIVASRLDGSGSLISGPFDAATTSSAKSRLAAESSAVGFAGLAWADDRVDSGGVYVQDVNPDGTLGPGGAAYCFASDAACPCANGGAPTSGCDIPQLTGGVELSLVAFAPDFAGGGQVTFTGTGFSPMGNPAAVMIRSASREDPPVVFGDGLRCIGVPLVRLAATQASGGVSIHTTGHGAGAGTFDYQIWFRSQPIGYCDPLSAFNLSNGFTLTWP